MDRPITDFQRTGKQQRQYTATNRYQGSGHYKYKSRPGVIGWIYNVLLRNKTEVIKREVEAEYLPGEIPQPPPPTKPK